VQNLKQKIKIILFISFLSFAINAYADFFDESAIALENRIAPIGKVKLSSSASKASSLTTSNIKAHLGKTLFKSKCALCHSHGLAGAPRLGNKADWEPRIKKRFSLLLKHASTGYRAMPPKGACLECSVADLGAAINYMLEQLHLSKK
jgi:cytochrome c5